MKITLRKASALAGALAAGALVSLASTGAAQAVTTARATSSACPAEITHPNISIHEDAQFVGYSLIQSCGATDASWEVVGPSSWDDTSLYYPGYLYNTYYSWYEGSHLGKYTLVPTGASSATGFNDVPQATEYFYVKDATHAAPNGFRSYGWVYLRSYVSRYNPNANYGLGAYTASGGRYVTLQDYYSGAWHTAGYKWTGSNGWTGYLKIWAPTGRYFRARVSATATLWNSGSWYLYR